MTKLFCFVGSIVGGYAGWYPGEALGWNFLVCFLLSGVGSIIGIVVGWKVAQRIA